MPQFPFTQALAANQLGFDPLTNWQYRTVPAVMGPHAVKLLTRSTLVGVRLTIYSGAMTIQQRAPVQAGGTAGVTPSELESTPVVWVAQPSDLILLQFDEVAGTTPTIDGVIIIEPL